MLIASKLYDICYCKSCNIYKASPDTSGDNSDSKALAAWFLTSGK